MIIENINQSNLWKNYEEITSEKLNNIQDRICRNKIIIIPVSMPTKSPVILPISYNDIVNYINSNIMIAIHAIDENESEELCLLRSFEKKGNVYLASFFPLVCSANGPNDFLVAELAFDPNNFPES